MGFIPRLGCANRGKFAIVVGAAVLAALTLAPAASAQNFGANLNRPSNWGLSCDWYPAAGVGPFNFNSQPTCTWSAVANPFGADPGEGLQVPGTGTVTSVRVKTGTSAYFGPVYPPGPMRVEVLRAYRSPYVPPGSNVGDAVCCDVVAESQIFTPGSQTVTEVPVNLPVTAGLDAAGIENVDYLGLTVFQNVQVPGHDTFRYGAGEGPSAAIFYPHVNLGEQNRSFGGYGGVQLLMNASFTPAPSGGSGGGPGFTVGGPNGLRLPVTVPGAGQIGVRDANDTIGRDLYLQLMKDSDTEVPRKKKKLSLKPSAVTAPSAGTYDVQLKLAGKAKKKYKRGRTAKVSAAVSFTPDGGTGSTQTLKLKLKK